VSRRNSLGASKKRGTRASADSAKDAVQVDETEFKGIDVGKITKLSLALATVTVEAASVQLYKFKVGYRRRRLTVSREAFVTFKQILYRLTGEAGRHLIKPSELWLVLSIKN